MLKAIGKNILLLAAFVFVLNLIMPEIMKGFYDAFITLNPILMIVLILAAVLPKRRRWR